jgi:hypothetical protein
MPYLKKAAVLFAFIIIGTYAVNAQATGTTAAKPKSKRHYTFTPTSYSSASGGRRQLVPADYTLEIIDDSLNVFLPYYGTSYSAQINQTDGGTRFTSNNFEYSFVEKTDQVEITIKPKDAKGVQQLFLRVYSDGQAMLQVTSTNREPTSFNGYLVVK